MKASMFNDKTPITREWLEEMLKPEDGDDDKIELRPIDDLCAEWVGRTVGEFAELGFRRAAHEVLNDGMLPHVNPIGMHSNERFVAWQFFKADVIKIAGEFQGQSGRAVMEAVIKRFNVSDARKREVSYYVARALQVRQNAILGVPFVDSLPPMGTLVLGE